MAGAISRICHYSGSCLILLLQVANTLHGRYLRAVQNMRGNYAFFLEFYFGDEKCKLGFKANSSFLTYTTYLLPHTQLLTQHNVI